VTFGGNCLRARPPSRSRLARASSSYSIQLAFDDHRIHVIEHEVMVAKSLVALLANQDAGG
jgi:hypothetical protein